MYGFFLHMCIQYTFKELKSLNKYFSYIQVRDPILNQILKDSSIYDLCYTMLAKLNNKFCSTPKFRIKQRIKKTSLFLFLTNVYVKSLISDRR